jgi:spermidine synthase
MAMERTIQSLLLFLAVASGIAGLGYEMLWTKSLTTALGHEVTSVLAVLSAYFVGMALGAWALQGPLDRAKRPAFWYALLEILAGLWALALAFHLPFVSTHAVSMLSQDPSLLEHWLFAFSVPIITLFPATFAMGATLPALERWMSQLRCDGWVVGGVYGANTLGAALGVILTTFLIAPEYGYFKTGLVMVMINLCCAIAAVILEIRYKPSIISTLTLDSGIINGLSNRSTSSTIGLAAIFITGLLGIGLEVVVMRALNQVLENTVYTFAVLLVIYLVGTSIGAWLYHHFARNTNPRNTTKQLINLAAMGVTFTTAVLFFTQPLHNWLIGWLGKGYTTALLTEITIGIVAFFPPAMAVGALFSHLMQCVRGPRTTIGHSMAINTFGSALAPLVFGVLLLPMLGIKATIILIAVGYLMLYLILGRQPSRYIFAPIVSLLILVFIPADLSVITTPKGGELVAHRIGITASVSVVSDRQDHLHLKVNDRFQMGGTSSLFSDRREGHIPLLLHPDPKHALFLGVGAGVTFASAAEYPNLKADAIELIPEVLEMLPYFTDVSTPLYDNDRLSLKTGDARRFVATADHTYDVVIADLFHPARDGAASLYTREHFTKIKNLLSSSGLFCQWLPLYQLDRTTLNTIIRTFIDVYPNGSAWLAHYSVDAPILGLIGSRTDIRLENDWLDRRVVHKQHFDALKNVRLHEPLALPGGFLGGSLSLLKFAGQGSFNTDDHPVVLYQAPGYVYRDKNKPSDLLLQVIHGIHAKPDDILLGPHAISSKAYTRLSNYWLARNNFIVAGVQTDRSRDPYTLLHNIEEPLFAVLKTSPDFSPAYRPLINLATLLAKRAPDTSRELLQRLEQTVPNRYEATLTLQHLFNQY